MYKLLIVEDERWEREGLAGFLEWEAMGIELAGAARDGIEGLEMFRELAPDIVITDIRMPGLDGLAMTEEIKRLRPQTPIIILTGYGDFEYARKALHLQASQYVLKPTTEEDLMAALHVVLEECGKNEERRQKEKEWETLVTERRSSLRQSRSEAVLQGKLDRAAAAELLADSGFPAGAGDYAALTVPDSGPWSREQIAEAVGAPHVAVRTEEFGGCWHLVAALATDSFPKQLARRLAEQGRFLRPEDIVVGIGTPARDVTQIGLSHQTAVEAAAHQLFWTQKGLFGPAELEEAKTRYHASATGMLSKASAAAKEIVFSVHALDEDRAVRVHGEMFDALAAGEAADREFVRSQVKGLHYELLLLAGSADSGEDAEVEWPQDASFAELRRLSEATLRRSLELLADKREGKDDYVVRITSRLVETRYMDAGLSLKSAAEDVFLTPNYLGALFKKSTGRSFHDYLTQYRMAKAKDLLANSESKVSRVAKEVGIPGTSYFCTLFKNSFGMTPGEYQELIHRK